jgi:hypothetical protein
MRNGFDLILLVIDLVWLRGEPCCSAQTNFDLHAVWRASPPLGHETEIHHYSIGFKFSNKILLRTARSW